MKHVYTARDAMDAHFVRGLLEQEGIKAVVQGEALQETWGGVPVSAESLPSVWVEDADVALAAPVIQRYQETDRANATDTQVHTPRPKWKCAHCNEMVESQFDRCWHCGHPRPQGATLA